jgi:predicted membrane-bound mannosyltransferase
MDARHHWCLYSFKVSKLIFSISNLVLWTIRYSDNARKRYIYICASNVCVAVGFVTSMCTMNTVARYFSL